MEKRHCFVLRAKLRNSKRKSQVLDAMIKSGSAIRVGQRMVSRLRLMHIRIRLVIFIWYIMVLLKIIVN